MAHTAEEKKRLLNRVRRIMGQVAAIERVLNQEENARRCYTTFPPAEVPWMR
jgi:DNA-binding FrmR family transcriptional regulator